MKTLSTKNLNQNMEGKMISNNLQELEQLATAKCTDFHYLEKEPHILIKIPSFYSSELQGKPSLSLL